MTAAPHGATQPYLNGKNAWWLRLFLYLNIAVFLSITVGRQLSATSLHHYWQRLSTPDGLLPFCFLLATLVLNGVVGNQGKNRLVFWRWRDPLPGCRAFTVAMAKDPRIDVVRLRAKLNPLPYKPKEQNALWYRLYKAHSDKRVIWEAHRAYLLTRDMTGMAAIFLVGFSSGTFLVSIGLKLVTRYFFALLAQYLIIATSARNYGNRFVANVLVEESHA